MRSGHEVRVLCSRGRYLEGKGEAPARESRGGVDIRRVRATSFGKKRNLGRIVDYATFHVLAGARAAASRWADVVVTLTTPPLVGWMGVAAKTLWGTKHVNFVMDLHPDAEFEHGMIDRESLAGRVLEAVAATALRRADTNVVLGPYQGARVAARRVPLERITEIPVWSDGDEIAPVDHADNPLRRRMGWDGKFVVMYSGNAGIVHQFEEVLDAATELKDDDRIQFVFVGGGPRKAEIEEVVAERQLSNVTFLPYFDRDELRFSLTAADAHFMSLRPQHVGIAVPGKLYGILAAGRPVLFVGSPRCESAETVVESGAGAVFEPGEGERLAATIRELRADPDTCRRMGQRGREHFLRVHELDVCVEAWRVLLEALANGEELDGASASALPDVDALPAALPRRSDSKHSEGSRRATTR